MTGEGEILRDDALEARRKADQAMSSMRKDGAKTSNALALQSIALSLAVLARLAVDERESRLQKADAG